MKLKIYTLALVLAVILTVLGVRTFEHAIFLSSKEKILTTELNSIKLTSLKSLEISVIYMDRKALPPNTELEITLEDISKADTASTLIASQSLQIEGPPPFLTTIEYDTKQIQNNNKYNVRATIKVADNLVFTSTTNLDPFNKVLTKPIKIKVSRLPDSKAVYIDNKANSKFNNRYWKLVYLNKDQAIDSNESKQRYIRFSSEQNIITGFSGCNHFTGSFKANNGKLIMGPVTNTSKVCLKGMEQEQAFLKAIGEIAIYKVKDETLTVKDSNSKLLAIFNNR